MMSEKHQYVSNAIPALTLDKDTIKFVKNVLMDKKKQIYKPATILTSTVFFPDNHNLLSRYMTLPTLESPNMKIFADRMVEPKVMNKVVRKVINKFRFHSHTKISQIHTLDGVSYDPNEYKFHKSKHFQSVDKLPSNKLSKTQRAFQKVHNKTLSNYFIHAKRQRGQMQNERLEIISKNMDYKNELTDEVSEIMSTRKYKTDSKEIGMNLENAACAMEGISRKKLKESIFYDFLNSI